MRRFRRRTAAVAGAILLSLTVVGGVVASQAFQLPPEKQAIEDRTAAERVVAAAKQPPKRDSGLLPATPQPTPTPRTGILDVQVSPFGSEVVVENRWQGYVNGELVEVYAGRLAGDPDQGFVGVGVPAPRPATSAPQSYRTPVAGPSGFTLERHLPPGKTGSLRITAEKNGRISLVARNGPTFVFDLASRSFATA